jgi:Concanavalin A-like lectin/glucanases superfamily
MDVITPWSPARTLRIVTRPRGALFAAATLFGAATLLAGCTPGPIDVAGLANSSLQMGMVAHWPLDDGTGLIAADRSGNTRNGGLVGGTWIGGHFGGALHFEAGTEITVPSFPAAMAGWSVALWVRPPAGDFGNSFITLISTEIPFIASTPPAVIPSGGWEMNAKITPTDTRYQFGYWRGPGVSDYDSYDCRCVVTDQWTHIAGVVDATAGTLSFYRDGVYQGQTAVKQPIRPGSATLYMGRWEMPGRQFTGDLDDIVVYSRVLTAAEVSALFRAPAPDPR